MKRPTTLLNRVLLDEELQVSCTIERDVLEIERRYEREGMGFLTITLPTLSEALETGLELGHIAPHMFHGFKPCKRGGRLPALLSGFFMRIFRIDGSLFDHPCIASIRAIRQVCRLFKKVELPCSSARIKRAYERYVSNDGQVSDVGDWDTVNTSLWTRVNSYLWSDLEILSGELYCFPGKFGSGATAERKKLNERQSVCVWPRRAESNFPASYHAVAYPCPVRLDELQWVEEGDETPVRVVQVPKTLKTPRTISVEPSYMMLMQQSIAQPLMKYLEGSRFPYKSIRFSDQSVNRDLARTGSIDGSLSTIDLSDASDLVSNDLVTNMFQGVAPSFLDMIQACRSHSARLPDGSVVKLRKYASMGSALCFPIESMVFFTIACYSMIRQTGGVPSRKKLELVTAKLAVYGDDIIVPTEMVSGLMDDLRAFGLKVNMSKSFVSGFFKESCGGDYYKGHDVTPTYVRRWSFTGNTSEANIMVSWMSLANQFYMKGLWHAADYVRSYLESKSKHRIPISKREIGCLHFVSVVFSDSLHYDGGLHRYTVRGHRIVTQEQEDELSELHGALFHTFLKRGHNDALRSFDKQLGGGRNVRAPELALGYSSSSFHLDDEYHHSDSVPTETSRVRLYSDIDPLERARGSLDYLLPKGGESSTTSAVPHVIKLKREWILSNDSMVF